MKISMKRLTKLAGVALLLLGFAGQVQGQGTEEDRSYKPLTLKINEEGSKYLRFIIWHQQWAQTNNLAVEDANLQLTHFARRSRFLAYAQITSRFLILTHIGLNNLTPGNLSRTGNDPNANATQFFLHDAWTEFKVSNDDALYIGGGLHYWKGLTRLSNQSTLNFMTMDNPRPFVHWHSLAVTDQFARHLGVYAKGQMGKFDYRIAYNNPGRNGIQADLGDKDSGLSYDGFAVSDSDGNAVGNDIFEGYLRYNFLEAESIKLPYQVGSYLGSKKVFGIGGGFFLHPNGMYNGAAQEHVSVSHLAVDAFLDMPLGEDDCLNAYASIMSFNYGDNFVSRWAGTGTVFYGHVGYKPSGSKFMPYVAYQNGSYQGFEENTSSLDIGLNYFVNGHNAKLTLEYHSIMNDRREGGVDFNGNIQDVRQLRLQAHIFL